MRKLFLYATLITTVLSACKNGTGPDVSGIKADVHISRFEQAFFTIDTNNILPGLHKVKSDFPAFFDDFTYNILAIGHLTDTSTLALDATRQFASSYYSVNKELQQSFSDVSWLQKDLTNAFRHVKYYFPNYPVPNVVTYIGPFDGPGIALMPSGLGIGLQLYGGKNFQFYSSMQGQDLFPSYVSRRFSKEYITTDCMKMIATDIYPDKSSSLSMIEQMIEKGKYWHLTKAFVPETPDSIITYYSQDQLDWCAANEGMIWNYLLQNDLYTIDHSIIDLYMGEGPSTQGFPSGSPGNIGQWVGWQIIKKYLQAHKDISVQQLMQTNPKVIFEEAKYKPK